jgi:hypothetical protein
MRPLGPATGFLSAIEIALSSMGARACLLPLQSFSYCRLHSSQEKVRDLPAAFAKQSLRRTEFDGRSTAEAAAFAPIVHLSVAERFSAMKDASSESCGLM